MTPKQRRNNGYSFVYRYTRTEPSELDEAVENFYRAHDDYHRSLTKVEAQEESVSYFTVQVTKYLNFKERIDLFRQRCERISLPAFDRVRLFLGVEDTADLQQ